MESVSHIINIPRLFSLCGGNIGPHGLGSNNRAASWHTVNKIYHFQTIRHLWKLYIITTKQYPFRSLDYPSEFQDDGTCAKFVFLVREYSQAVETFTFAGMQL